MLSSKNLEILRGVMAFLVLFEQILIKILLLIRSLLPNMMHFVRTFSIYTCLPQTRGVLFPVGSF